MHAIELKTDNHSVDDEQIAYYHKFEKIDVEKLFDFIIKTKRTGMVMVVGVSQKDRVSTLLGKLPQEEVLLVYSTWDGYYKDPNQVKVAPKYKDFRDMFHNVVDIHTAGHADRQTITKVIETVSPKDVICIHKEADASL